MFGLVNAAARVAACLLVLAAVCRAQDSMPGMDMGAPAKTANEIQSTVLPYPTLSSVIWRHTGSGTSAEPGSISVPMWWRMHGGWMLMLHGTAFVSDVQQSGPRGADKLFSTNWAMPMAMHDWGRQRLTLRGMFSLEPATVTGRYYPELFQQGETAYGRPIVDGQHPHDFVMELAALYDVRFGGGRGLVSLYAAPVGDPALGPTAYPHRWTASENPMAALGHHQEDSTHIAFNVLTGGMTWRALRVEASGFHGAEPDEQRWHFQPSPNGLAVDSYSTRVTVAPGRDWSGQYSIARIASPEALYPGEDQQRQTASAMYHHGFGAAEVGATSVWGRTRSLSDNAKENSYLCEAMVQWGGRSAVWTRVENAGRTNELLLTPGSALPAGFQERPLGHVQGYSFGYDREYRVGFHLKAAPGAQGTVYSSSPTIRGVYGTHSFGMVLFVRIRMGQ